MFIFQFSLENSEKDDDLANFRKYQQRRHSHQPFLKTTGRPSIVNLREMNQQLDLKTGLSPRLNRRTSSRAALLDGDGLRRSPERRPEESNNTPSSLSGSPRSAEH
jgi:hypothetical protein